MCKMAKDTAHGVQPFFLYAHTFHTKHAVFVEPDVEMKSVIAVQPVCS